MRCFYADNASVGNLLFKQIVPMASLNNISRQLTAINFSFEEELEDLFCRLLKSLLYISAIWICFVEHYKHKMISSRAEGDASAIKITVYLPIEDIALIQIQTI